MGSSFSYLSYDTPKQGHLHLSTCLSIVASAFSFSILSAFFQQGAKVPCDSRWLIYFTIYLDGALIFQV